MSQVDRRGFIKGAVGLSTVVATGMTARGSSKQVMVKPLAARGGFPAAMIGNREMSRMLIGGNPFSGISHSEPLLYPSRVFKQYFTREKVVETLSICVQNGINTFLGRIDENVIGFLKLYEKTYGERMPWIAQTSAKAEKGATKQQIQDNIRVAADNGAIGCYVQGVSADFLVAKGNVGHIEEHVALMRKLGMLGGIGAHVNKTIEETAKAGLKPDFYMKTINRLGYNAVESDRTAQIMATVEAPWIAFKVLGAGRIDPEEGFAYALKAGADFLCVGMFDFQVEDNVKLARKLMSEMPT